LRAVSANTSCGINSLPATNHQPEFAAHCVTTAADQALVDDVLAKAWTAVDMAKTAAIRNRLLGVTSS
jgi:hypothetical protein